MSDDNHTFEWRGETRDPSRSRSETCKKCGKPGHRAKTCGRSKPEPKWNMTCGNCGVIGHNRMTCKNPHNPDYVPARYVSQHSGRTRCSRCGGKDHNSLRCQQTEITRTERVCPGCGLVRGLKSCKNVDAPKLCRACYRASVAIKPRQCAGCGREFMPTGKHASEAKVCSWACRSVVISKSLSGRFESLEGVVFGWWTVIAHVRAKHCAVRCRCGFETMLPSGSLRKGTGSQACRSCTPKKKFEEMTDDRRQQIAAYERASANRGLLGVTRKRPDEDQRAGRLRRREDRKALLNKYKRFPCLDCGLRFAPVCMDFDHRPGEVKVSGLSKMVIKAASFDAIIEEMGKCDLVCSNCHRIRTYKRMLDETGQLDSNGGLIVE